MNASNPAALLPDLVALAREAGETVLRFYKGDHTVRRKADASPVTEADEASEQIILEGLTRLTPGVPAVSEEAVSNGAVSFDHADPPRRFWLVDPVDGTKEFVARTGEFTINIGLVEGSRPVLGVLHAPLAGVTYAAAGAGTAVVYRGNEAPRPIHVRPPPPSGLVVLASRSHGDKAGLAAFLEDYKVADRKLMGSAIKFGLIAEGAADLYARLGPTMEWDTCAGHAILESAGGHLASLAGSELRYGKRGFLNPDFVATGG